METSYQLHLPFHKYAGPGTHIVANIKNKVKPINNLDRASLIHDIEYSKSTNDIRADLNMVKNIIKKDPTDIPIAMLTGIAFALKNALGIRLSRKNGNYDKLKALAINNKLANERDFYL